MSLMRCAGSPSTTMRSATLPGATVPNSASRFITRAAPSAAMLRTLGAGMAGAAKGRHAQDARGWNAGGHVQLQLALQCEPGKRVGTGDDRNAGVVQLLEEGKHRLEGPAIQRILSFRYRKPAAPEP